MKKIVLAAVLAAVSATPAFAANSDTKEGTASATVVAPIELTHTTNAELNFGIFTAGVGTVVVDASTGAGTATAGVTLMGDSVESADEFTLTGDPDRGFDISTTGTALLPISLGTGLSFVTTPSAASGTLSATGTAGFTVGGTLTVTAAAGAGVYSTTYDATVTYN